MYSNTQAATTETLLRVVADPERRAILSHLRATDSRAVDVQDLSEAIESRGVSGDAERSQLSIELRHTHLPMLAEENMIEYDRERNYVAYRADDRTEALLTFVADRLE